MNLAILCFIFAIISFGAVFAHSHKSKDPITITDANWTNVLEGEWMIEFMAPWSAKRCGKSVRDGDMTLTSPLVSLM